MHQKHPEDILARKDYQHWGKEKGGTCKDQYHCKEKKMAMDRTCPQNG